MPPHSYCLWRPGLHPLCEPEPDGTGPKLEWPGGPWGAAAVWGPQASPVQTPDPPVSPALLTVIGVQILNPCSPVWAPWGHASSPLLLTSSSICLLSKIFLSQGLCTTSSFFLEFLSALPFYTLITSVLSVRTQDKSSSPWIPSPTPKIRSGFRVLWSYLTLYFSSASLFKIYHLCGILKAQELCQLYISMAVIRPEVLRNTYVFKWMNRWINKWTKRKCSKAVPFQKILFLCSPKRESFIFLFFFFPLSYCNIFNYLMLFSLGDFFFSS